MKKLIIVNGTMGVGKTETCKLLYKTLKNSVWLDGDWCWMMNPFIVTEENKGMVLDNITHMLNNFLQNSGFDYVIFNWVMHLEEIFETILSRLKENEFQLYKISLMCSEDELKKRMIKDNRAETVITNSLQRIDMYNSLNTIKVDTTYITIEEVVKEICEVIGTGK